MSKRGVFEMSVPGFVGVMLMAVCIGLFFGDLGDPLFDDGSPTPIETRVVYTGPAAQIVDTNKIQIEPDKDGRLRIARSIITYTLDNIERSAWYDFEDGNGWVRELYGGPELAARYKHHHTVTDTICYEPVKCESER